MGLISPGGENLLDFLELRQVLSTYDGYLRDPLWWPQERPVPMELLGGLSVFISRRCRGLRPFVDSVPEPEDSSPVLTWILGYFWNLPRGDSRIPPRSMSALEMNPQVPAPTPDKLLGPGIDGRGIPRGPRATRMGTGLS